MFVLRAGGPPRLWFAVRGPGGAPECRRAVSRFARIMPLPADDGRQHPTAGTPMLPLDNLIAFFGIAVLLALTPGPDNLSC